MPESESPVRSHLEAVLAHLGSVEGQRILDLGCGEGALARELAERGAEVTGIDPNMPDHPWQAAGRGRWRIVRAAAEALPIESGSIDSALFIFSLHHMPALAGALDEVARVLRPTGTLYVAEPLARGDCHDVVVLFHDETEVRRQAAAILHSRAPQRFNRHVSEIYAERRVIADFDRFAERMIANQRFNGYTTEAVLAPAVRATFEAIVARTEGVFDQPVRIDCFSNA